MEPERSPARHGLGRGFAKGETSDGSGCRNFASFFCLFLKICLHFLGIYDILLIVLS
jgi:hypothetical protein